MPAAARKSTTTARKPATSARKPAARRKPAAARSCGCGGKKKTVRRAAAK